MNIVSLSTALCSLHRGQDKIQGVVFGVTGGSLLSSQREYDEPGPVHRTQEMIRYYSLYLVFLGAPLVSSQMESTRTKPQFIGHRKGFSREGIHRN